MPANSLVNSPANFNESQNTPILLGTGNPSKQETLVWLLEGLPLTLASPSQLGLSDPPEEHGGTHQEIANDKALAWSQSGSMLAIASDGGLVLPALGDAWESRYTHRFAGPSATNAQRVERLLELMEPFHGEQRKATWVEAVAIAHRGEILASWELKGARGVITDIPSAMPGIDGFWAFSLWRFPALGKTYDQLTQEEREGLDDHWAQLRTKVQEFFRRKWMQDQ